MKINKLIISSFMLMGALSSLPSFASTYLITCSTTKENKSEPKITGKGCKVEVKEEKVYDPSYPYYFYDDSNPDSSTYIGKCKKGYYSLSLIPPNDDLAIYYDAEGYTCALDNKNK